MFFSAPPARNRSIWASVAVHFNKRPEDYPLWLVTARSMQYSWGSNVAVPILADVASQVQVTEEGLRAFYDQVAAERYTTSERRRARHILVESGSDDAAAQAPGVLEDRLACALDMLAVADAAVVAMHRDDLVERALVGDLRQALFLNDLF